MVYTICLTSCRLTLEFFKKSSKLLVSRLSLKNGNFVHPSKKLLKLEGDFPVV